METLFVEQSLSPSNRFKNPKRKTHHNHQVARMSNISRQPSRSFIDQNFAPPQQAVHEFEKMMMHVGVFPNAHPRPYSHSSSLPPMSPLQQQHMNIRQYHHQPPLLPLPVVSKPTFRSLPQLGRKSLSPPAPRKQPKKLSTPQKSKKDSSKPNNNNNNNPVSIPPKDACAKAPKAGETGTQLSTKPLGPNPESLPKDVTRMLLVDLDNYVGDMDNFSGSVFSLSPPPSSLPLPKFSLRQLQKEPKLSCKAEAAAEKVDAGATDNIRRMLRLRNLK